jgi:uncharacterized membrane protein
MNKTPLHPLLVHLPIGSWIAALILDLTFMANHNPLIAAGSFCCILIGVIGALIAAPFGFSDYLEISSNSLAKKLATTHLLLNLAVVAFYCINLFSRFQLNHAVPSIITGGQLSLSIFSVLLLAVSGYVGGLLVFEFGIGVQKEQTDGDELIKRAA